MMHPVVRRYERAQITERVQRKFPLAKVTRKVTVVWKPVVLGSWRPFADPCEGFILVHGGPAMQDVAAAVAKNIVVFLEKSGIYGYAVSVHDAVRLAAAAASVWCRCCAQCRASVLTHRSPLIASA